MIKKKILHILLLLGVVLLVELYLYSQHWNKKISFYPSTDKITQDLFSDQNNGIGKSHITSKTERNKTEISYTLSEEYKWPFAGIRFLPENHIDISAYDTIKIHVTVDKPQKQIIGLWTVPDKTLREKVTEHPQHYELQLLPNTEFYAIPLTSFETPPWWFIQHKLSQSDITINPLTELLAIGIRSGYNPRINEEYTFSIHGITIIADNKPIVQTMIGVFLGWILVSLLYLLIKTKTTQEIYIPLREIEEHSTEKNASLINITKTIGELFDNPLLSLSKVADTCHLPEYEISKALKEHYNLTFKQYLNKLRLEHAKKLLETTDLSVKEVCFKSGYKTTSHFFRIFRSFFQISPAEYRESMVEKQKKD